MIICYVGLNNIIINTNRFIKYIFELNVDKDGLNSFNSSYNFYNNNEIEENNVENNTIQNNDFDIEFIEFNDVKNSRLTGGTGEPIPIEDDGFNIDVDLFKIVLIDDMSNEIYDSKLIFQNYNSRFLTFILNLKSDINSIEEGIYLKKKGSYTFIVYYNEEEIERGILIYK